MKAARSESGFDVTRSSREALEHRGHQGPFFDDGPPRAGLRYCIDSLSLELTPEGEPLPDELGRDAPKRKPWRAAAGARRRP